MKRGEEESLFDWIQRDVAQIRLEQSMLPRKYQYEWYRASMECRHEPGLTAPGVQFVCHEPKDHEGVHVGSMWVGGKRYITTWEEKISE